MIMKPIVVLSTLITMIVLSLPTIIILLFSKEPIEESVSEPINMEENLEAESAVMVNVERSATSEVESIPLEQYVASVVASEMPADFELEALKAQALAARTYIVQYLLATGSVDPEQTITDTVQHQVYRNDVELKELWGSDYHWKMEKITEAVRTTAGQILTYDQSPITPVFFSTSNGKTENAEDYWENALPYLVSVDSPWDLESPKYLDQKSIPTAELEQELGINLTEPINEPPMTYTDSHRVQTVELGGHTFTGREVRETFDLQSTDFEIEQKNDHIIFTTRGFGHGVGMSQYGANGMAQEGKSYQDIVTHYYRGVEISTIDEINSPYLAKK
ncbi:stage II sporulation protein D [Amphibacillus sp. MSJ-3]|nr:stage II sporulation protein D [Amphibacillus sp. MSJ-3]MBU5594343.1 stage II sporulation protein D [Amphibacillus sp. MSJ-3]